MSTCKIIRRHVSEGFHGKQGLDYFSGISAETAGAKGICLHLLAMPPGAEAKPHYHEAHETAIYMLEGAAEFRHGHRLENVDRVEAGDFIYIPAGVPHLPANTSGAPSSAVIARTDPNEQESVVLRPDLEGRVP